MLGSLAELSNILECSYFQKVSLTNFGSALDNSITDCISLIVLRKEGFVHFKAATLRKPR